VIAPICLMSAMNRVLAFSESPRQFARDDSMR
jgi:hypothetical protein